MTIGAASRVSLACDGTTKVFPVAIQAYAATDLTVILTAPASAGGGETTLVLNSDYSMAASGTLSPTAWTLTTLPAAAYATGYTLQVFENPVQTQQTQFVQGQPFPSLAVQTAFDRLTQMVHRLQDQISRAIRAPDGDVLPTMLLPFAAARANLGIVFDALGNAVLGALSATVLTGTNILGLIFDLGYRYRIHPAESLAGLVAGNLTFGFDPYDLRRYSADPTGVLASDAALVNAVAVCGVTGGTIRLPAGKYTFASPITSLANKSSIILQGDGSATGGAQPATQIVYSGTGAALFIDFRSSVGCKIRDCQILHTNAGYTGTYMKFGNDGSHGDGPFCELSNCVIGSSVNGVGNAHLDLDKCICFTAYNCNFIYGNPSVIGMAASSYSNVIRFRDCHFVTQYQAPILRQGQAWMIEGCTFEALLSGAAGGIAGATPGTSPANGIVVKGNWFGDVTNTAPAGSWIDGSLTGVIEGNYFSGNVTSNNTTAITLRQAAGLSITGNSFASLLTAINFATGSCFGIVCKGNLANLVGTAYQNPQNVPLGQLSFSIGFGFGVPVGHSGIATNGYRVRPDGTIQQWGLATSLANGANTVTFPIAFPGNCFNVQVTLNGVLATTARAFAGIVTATNFSLTLNDAGATTDTAFWTAIGN